MSLLIILKVPKIQSLTLRGKHVFRKTTINGVRLTKPGLFRVKNCERFLRITDPGVTYITKASIYGEHYSWRRTGYFESQLSAISKSTMPMRSGTLMSRKESKNLLKRHK